MVSANCKSANSDATAVHQHMFTISLDSQNESANYLVVSNPAAESTQPLLNRNTLDEQPSRQQPQQDSSTLISPKKENFVTEEDYKQMMNGLHSSPPGRMIETAPGRYAYTKRRIIISGLKPSSPAPAQYQAQPIGGAVPKSSGPVLYQTVPLSVLRKARPGQGPQRNGFYQAHPYQPRANFPRLPPYMVAYSQPKPTFQGWDPMSRVAPRATFRRQMKPKRLPHIDRSVNLDHTLVCKPQPKQPPVDGVSEQNNSCARVRPFETETCARLRPYADTEVRRLRRKQALERHRRHPSSSQQRLQNEIGAIDWSQFRAPDEPKTEGLAGGVVAQRGRKFSDDEPIDWSQFTLPEEERMMADWESKQPNKKTKQTYLVNLFDELKSQSCARVRELSSTFVCARFRPYAGLRKSRAPFYFMIHPERTFEYRPPVVKQRPSDFMKRSGKGRWLITAEMPLDLQYGRYLLDGGPSISLRRSQIHGVGVYAEEDIEKGQLIIEYRGEVIRNSLVDLREAHYRASGFGSYMFAVDGDVTVDATKKGSVARFINHRCQPNCAAKIITHAGVKKIVLYAAKYIDVGSELSYDYKMPFEKEKIPCLCQSNGCRKYLN